MPGSNGYEVDVGDLSMDDVVVAVMGPTGSGKSSFIEKATGIMGMAGHGLESCTSKISVIKLPYPGVNLYLVDTPGFDDTYRSDVDIFKMISAWLIKTCRNQIHLTGLLYFHPISDNRLAGTSLKNFHFFGQLCGEEFNNIVLTTTMWDQVDQSEGARREDELKRNFWRPMIDCGASVRRFLYTPESAFAILCPFFTMLNGRRPVLLQREMNERGLALKDTSAGKTLRMDFDGLVTQIQGILKRIQKASKNPNADLRQLIEEYEEAIMQLDRATQDMRKMEVSTGNWIQRFSKKFNSRLSRIFSVKGRAGQSGHG